MTFVLTALSCYLISAPGMYLLLRARLATSVAEILAPGFFFGFGLSSLFYIALGPHAPMPVLDGSACALSILAMGLVAFEVHRRPLPILPGSPDRMSIVVVTFVMLFMLLFAFCDLTRTIDDDLFIHLPNIKRVSMGDVPPHFPYFPSSLLRGHVARDVFTGTIARYIDLRPEVAIVYVTLAICPAYVGTAYALAFRLAKGSRYPTLFCFFGMLFLVSFAIGTYEIRSGSITYVLNNNAFAFGYAFFFGWLIERVVTKFADDDRSSRGVYSGLVAIGILTAAHAAQYFIYISNFLIFSLLIGALPFLLALTTTENRKRVFLQSAGAVVLVGIGVVVLHVVVSPLFVERIMISLNLAVPTAPMGILQQAQLTFPKAHLFSITTPNGNDEPFFTLRSLGRQGLSFYVGLAGLIVGLWTRNARLAAASLLGWLAMLWMLLVDMGQYRAEPLRLFLLAHIGFGASTGLIVGLTAQRFAGSTSTKATVVARPAMALIAALVLCGWLARDNIRKFWVMRPLGPGSIVRMASLLEKDDENWYAWIAGANGQSWARGNSRRRPIDFDAFDMLQEYIKRPTERLLLKIPPDPRLRTYALGQVTPMITASSRTGAGIVGVSQEHAPPKMSVAIFPYNYTASLFWQAPSAELLAQLSPDWILLDPSLITEAELGQIEAIPGVGKVWSLDSEGGRRILLRYVGQQQFTSTEPLGSQLVMVQPHIQTSPFALVEAIATVEPAPAIDALKVALLVTDLDEQPANVMDSPVVDAARIDSRRFKLRFSMIQPGHWHVYFLDPFDRTRLNSKPLLVDVGK